MWWPINSILMHISNAADSKQHCQFWASFSVQFPFPAVVAVGHVSHVAYLEIDRREVSTMYVTWYTGCWARRFQP